MYYITDRWIYYRRYEASILKDADILKYDVDIDYCPRVLLDRGWIDKRSEVQSGHEGMNIIENTIKNIILSW